MIPAMDGHGRLFECEEYFVPELLPLRIAMKGPVERLEPLPAAAGAQLAGRVTVTLPAMRTTVGALTDVGVRNRVKVAAGDSPVAAHLADETRAGDYSDNTGAARTLAGVSRS
jgi:methanogenic corrinoid protein MtbC1